jgi:hypothetical protein
MQGSEQPADGPDRDEGTTVIDAPLSLGPAKIYDLTNGEEGSNAFFNKVAEFAECVVAEAEHRAAPLLDEYNGYMRFATSEPARTRGEHALELLTLGMTLRLYSLAAARTPEWAVGIADWLLRARRRSEWLKPAADFARGCVFRFCFATPADTTDPGLARVSRLPRLLRWLEATGEFREETARLRHWQGYLDAASSHASTTCLQTAVCFFDWFAAEAAEALGGYTKGVRAFLGGAYLRRGVREDRFFCGRRPVEYHLGMVAAEIMNQALEPEFELTTERVLLVPACMRGARAATCKALVTGLDMICMGCDPECQVHQVSSRMRQQGVRVHVVPHATGFSRWLERWQGEKGVGVAAVACLLNILPGGYEMRRRGIASQCVPLDHPGCRKHWGPQNLSTRVNQEKLVQLVTTAPGRSQTDAIPPQLG